MKNIYVGILAGGSGSRLWPLSNTQHPKQLLPFINKTSLLEQTIERIKALSIPQEHLFIITNQEQEHAVKATVGNLVGSYVIEPSGRNTAPAILLGCHYVQAQDPDAIVLFIPADHFIPDITAWSNALKQALSYAQNHTKLILLGLKPTHPATGYGYIQTQSALSSPFKPIHKFHEKPSRETAEAYLTRSDMFWNIGIFTATVKTFFQEFKTYAPAIYNTMEKFRHGSESYNHIPHVSIDYAIMEKTNNAVLLPSSFTWYDVGNLTTFLSLKDKYEKNNTPVISVNGENNLASSSKQIIACVGVSNLCIVETDSTLLIVSQDQVEQVKDVIKKVETLEL